MPPVVIENPILNSPYQGSQPIQPDDPLDDGRSLGAPNAARVRCVCFVVLSMVLPFALASCSSGQRSPDPPRSEDPAITSLPASSQIMELPEPDRADACRLLADFEAASVHLKALQRSLDATQWDAAASWAAELQDDGARAQIELGQMYPTLGDPPIGRELAKRLDHYAGDYVTVGSEVGLGLRRHDYGFATSRIDGTVEYLAADDVAALRLMAGPCSGKSQY